MAKIVREDGVEVLLNAQAQSVRRVDGQIQLTVGLPSDEQQISGSHLLVATGRTPNTEHLNLGAAGVQVDKRGFVQVNDRLETNVPGIYALGDVKGGPAFTHISYDDFRILRGQFPARRAGDHHRPAGAVHRFHRSAAGQNWLERG